MVVLFTVLLLHHRKRFYTKLQALYQFESEWEDIDRILSLQRDVRQAGKHKCAVIVILLIPMYMN